MKQIVSSFRNRVAALRADESGMEAAQVILILALVVIVMIPIFNKIMTAMSTQGSNAAKCIGAPTSC